MNRETNCELFYLSWNKNKTENLKLLKFRLRKRLPKIDLDLPEIKFEEQELLFC